MTSLKLCSHRQYNDMFFFCLSINDKRTKEQNSVAFQRILLQNWNSGGDSLEKFPFKAHSHSAKLPLLAFDWRYVQILARNNKTMQG